MRITDEFLDCVIFLYPSQASAERGEKTGGGGFVAGIESAVAPDAWWLYAVTSRHVIEDGKSRTIRLNTEDGGLDTIDTELDSWVRADQDDLAVYSLSSSQLSHNNISFVREDQFLTSSIVKRYGIGPGDEAFMVGRFINHEGQQTNMPAVRFGNVSMMPLEPVKHPLGFMQQSFIVEMRSYGGFSGSPVFVYIPPSDVPFRRTEEHGCGPWLLGVDWGHLPERDHVDQGISETPHDDPGIKRNTGMAAVIPAWRLRELLYSDELVRERKKLDDLSK